VAFKEKAKMSGGVGRRYARYVMTKSQDTGEKNFYPFRANITAENDTLAKMT
jgi:hypothetical protein